MRYVKDSEHIDVEIKVRDEGGIVPKSRLSQTITLIILDVNLLKAEKNCYNTYTLASTASDAELTDLFKISYLELEKFNESKGAELQVCH